MNVIVAGTVQLAANMVRGALQQANTQNAEVKYCDKADQIKDSMTEDCIVLVDWDHDPLTDVLYVNSAKEAFPKVPVLLLCSKAKAGTTFSGMKAGASGIVNKPFEAEELLRAITTAIKQGKAKKPTVNVEFINPFIDSTVNVLATMCQMEAKRKKLFLKDDHQMLGDVSGVMGLSGAATGSVVVSLPSKLACILVGKMLGEEPAETMTGEVSDAVGELINMIAGQAKASLVNTKYHFSISIPSVVSGPGHEISHKKGTPNIVVLFEVDGYDFAVQVCLAPTEE